MGTSYHQYCPVSKAMELLDERWTMLLIRELVLGSERFNDLRRGLPRMSPTLLSRRLQQLERAGVVERRVSGKDVRYTLTEAGHELRPVVEAVGLWGVRWIGELGDEDLDPKLLIWDMHRYVDATAIPPGRTVVQFRFPDAPQGQRDFWIILEQEEVDVCDFDPGYDVAVSVSSSLRTLTQVWRGDIGWSEALRSGSLEVQGPESMRRAVPRWFTLSSFAAVPRPEPSLVG
jgi:DNA-binding HxlR family transcriptional regulator